MNIDESRSIVCYSDVSTQAIISQNSNSLDYRCYKSYQVINRSNLSYLNVTSISYVADDCNYQKIYGKYSNNYECQYMGKLFLKCTNTDCIACERFHKNCSFLNTRQLYDTYQQKYYQHLINELKKQEYLQKCLKYASASYKMLYEKHEKITLTQKIIKFMDLYQHNMLSQNHCFYFSKEQLKDLSQLIDQLQKNKQKSQDILKRHQQELLNKRTQQLFTQFKIVQKDLKRYLSSMQLNLSAHLKDLYDDDIFLKMQNQQIQIQQLIDQNSKYPDFQSDLLSNSYMYSFQRNLNESYSCFVQSDNSQSLLNIYPISDSQSDNSQSLLNIYPISDSQFQQSCQSTNILKHIGSISSVQNVFINTYADNGSNNNQLICDYFLPLSQGKNSQTYTQRYNSWYGPDSNASQNNFADSRTHNRKYTIFSFPSKKEAEIKIIIQVYSIQVLMSKKKEVNTIFNFFLTTYQQGIQLLQNVYVNSITNINYQPLTNSSFSKLSLVKKQQSSNNLENQSGISYSVKDQLLEFKKQQIICRSQMVRSTNRKLFQRYINKSF